MHLLSAFSLAAWPAAPALSPAPSCCRVSVCDQSSIDSTRHGFNTTLSPETVSTVEFHLGEISQQLEQLAMDMFSVSGQPHTQQVDCLAGWLPDQPADRALHD